MIHFSKAKYRVHFGNNRMDSYSNETPNAYYGGYYFQTFKLLFSIYPIIWGVTEIVDKYNKQTM